jgi:hypothetical protein
LVKLSRAIAGQAVNAVLGDEVTVRLDIEAPKTA